VSSSSQPHPWFCLTHPVFRRMAPRKVQNGAGVWTSTLSISNIGKFDNSKPQLIEARRESEAKYQRVSQCPPHSPRYHLGHGCCGRPSSPRYTCHSKTLISASSSSQAALYMNDASKKLHNPSR
jgi:hypothetical protein